ncbi:DUF1016 domain-containing protein [Candidatus Woesearchaeota archaeon]|nr:DUF1016 domain-containing protein [Candidatus Woesearchaeota archaeon]
MPKRIFNQQYTRLIEDIGSFLEQARGKVLVAVNTILVETYWKIGRQIIEYEQKGKGRAAYGSKLLELLSKDLRLKYGERGFSERNVRKYRQFYLTYQKLPTLSAKLSWSHYVELLDVEENLARSFYEQQCVKESWSVRELKRQKNSLLFERIALSKDKEGVIKLSKKGQLVEKPADAIKEPYILEFLGLEESLKYSENEVESLIISKLKDFILELGRDFLFVDRQKRITIGNRHYRIDLIFYHRILKCFVLVDVKIGELSHADTGQMDFYLNYYKQEEKRAGENDPIGLILCASKNKEFAKYVLADRKNMFASEYKVKLPSETLLKQQLKKLLT